MSLQEMTETQDESSSNGQMPRKFSYANFTPIIRKGSPLTTTILRNGPHSLSHLLLKSLEPILPRGTVILLKSISKEFKTGWLYDEVLNSFFWLLQEKNNAPFMHHRHQCLLCKKVCHVVGYGWEKKLQLRISYSHHGIQRITTGP